MSSPNIFNRRTSVSRRRQAHELFLAGKSLDEVCEITGLKRKTAGAYLFEARCMFENDKKDLLK